VKVREILELASQRPPPDRLARCHSIADLASQARRRLPRAAYDYLEGGSEGEYTMRRNRAALDACELMPQVLRDVRNVDLTTTLMGAELPFPFILAPVGGPRLIHHEGELAVARAAAKERIPYAVSTLSSFSVERVTAEADGPLWFQLYVWGDRGRSKELIQRASESGYQALVLTADCSVRSKRERELRAGIVLPSPRLTARSIAEGAVHPAWAWRFLSQDRLSFPNLAGADAPDGTIEELSDLFDGSLTWADLEWIRATWDGPLVLKGVLSPDDARRAAELGVQAVVVSNHGGRQLDHVPATIDALPAVVDAVGDLADVLFDSGVRRGSDILAALSRGAAAVLIGRAYLYGLAAGGQAGVHRAVQILVEELRIAMALSGVSNVAAARKPAPVVPGRAERLAGRL
jgi:L-lactate dehydrogenase (cytochrome)